jgi:hypothetical protein
MAVVCMPDGFKPAILQGLKKECLPWLNLAKGCLPCPRCETGGAEGSLLKFPPAAWPVGDRKASWLPIIKGNKRTKT